MISLHKVTKQYDMGQKTTIVPVREVSLEIVPGEFMMIVGRSGTGKSTLLNLIVGLIRPTSGEVLIEGTNLRDMSDKEVSQLRSQKMGYVFQFPSLLPSLTIQENVAIPSIFAAKSSKRESDLRAAELLGTVGLSDKLGVYPKQLSAGEQKRAVIARSLINKPQVLLADEPTSDLDEQSEREVIGLLRDINKTGVTVLMVTHSLELLPYASRSFKMENGELGEIANKGLRTMKNPTPAR